MACSSSAPSVTTSAWYPTTLWTLARGASITACPAQVKAIFNFDPHLAAMPYSMLNFVAKKFCFYFLKFMRSNVKLFKGPKYTAKIRENWDVYGEIARRLKEAGMPCPDLSFVGAR